MKTETKKLIETIYKLEANDLDQVVQAVKMRRNQLHHVNANKLRPGDRVEFEGRHGITEKGTVEKIKIKYVLVRTDRGQRWNVPGSHLTQIGEVINA
jgi:hypothetical protein